MAALITTWLDNAIFFVQVELNETAVSSVLLSQSGDSGALIATWLDKHDEPEKDDSANGKLRIIHVSG